MPNRRKRRGKFIRFISKGTIEAINELRPTSVGFVLATGRRESSYTRVRDVIPHDYALIEHGCLIIDDGGIDYAWTEILKPVIGDIGRKNGPLWAYEQKLIAQGVKTDSEGRLATVRLYLEAQSQQTMLKGRIKAEAKRLGITTTMNEGALDLLPKKGGKANAIKRLSKSKGFSLEDVIVLCNDANDVGMLSIAAYVACPSDANDEVKFAVERKGGYVSLFAAHKGAEDILRNYVAMIK